VRTLESAVFRYRVKLSGNVLSLAFQANVSPGQCSKLYPQTLTHKTTPVSPGEQSLPLTVNH
jgi:hypothetical protein